MAYMCSQCLNPLKVIEVEINTVRRSTMSVIRREKTTQISCPRCGEASTTRSVAS